jgi:hypothetical protein
MGQGRNSIYLASLGLILHTSVVSEYDFGKQRFDLILFNWTMPVVPI